MVKVNRRLLYNQPLFFLAWSCKGVLVLVNIDIFRNLLSDTLTRVIFAKELGYYVITGFIFVSVLLAYLYFNSSPSSMLISIIKVPICIFNKPGL